MRPTLFLLFLAISLGARPVLAQGDEREVLAVVNQLFDAMRARDTAKMRSLLHKDARLASPGVRNGIFAVTVISPDSWLGQIGGSTGGVLDERITGAEVKVDGALASVWAAYSSHRERFSHCGVDAFHLVRMPEGWRIIDLADTRRRGLRHHTNAALNEARRPNQVAAHPSTMSHLFSAVLAAAGVADGRRAARGTGSRFPGIDTALAASTSRKRAH